MAVLPIPPRHTLGASPTVNVLMATLAFEAVVDALIAFDVRTGVSASPKMRPAERATYRAAVAELLNERNAEQRTRAEYVALESLSQSHEALSGCNSPDLGDVRRALDLYRDQLQKAPIAGVGVLR